METEGLRASQPVSKKPGPNPALSFQRLVSKAQLLTVTPFPPHSGIPEWDPRCRPVAPCGPRGPAPDHRRPGMDRYDGSPAPQTHRSTLRAHPGPRNSSPRAPSESPDSVRCKSRSRARNVRSDRRHGHGVMAGVHTNDIEAKTTSFQHFLSIELFHFVPSVRALRRPPAR